MFPFQCSFIQAICFIFEPDKGLPNHTHNGLATIQVLSDSLNMSFVNGEQHELKTEDFLLKQ